MTDMLTNPAIIVTLHLKMTEDTRITVWHISLYVCMLSLWHQEGFKKQVRITRGRLMRKARIKSITTYHKCIGDLRDFGYIKYTPTYDCYTGSVIEINCGTGI